MRIFTRNRRSARGFTLIELLVVIAIIAILAAILFPVFAQARAKARAMSCLSNVKQCGTAFHMYVQDYDEMCPSIWNGIGTCVAGATNCNWEWWYSLSPYVKSVDLFLCPDRVEGSPTSYNAYGQGLGMKRYSGFGYNWGPIGWRGGGLLGTQLRLPSGQTHLIGRSLAQVAFPAQTYAFGDTYDTPRMTVGIGFSADTWTGTSNSALRHSSGTFNYSFVDGHAKAIKVKGGFLSGAFNNKLIMPRDETVASYAYCADPNEMIVNGGASPDGTKIPSPIACGQIPAWINRNLPPCTASSKSGDNCLFTD
jgi:prepilin-type N-terminal cleavage/methylation domain-containing protein/prepilin-type processing-associated H-X9-DG protein